MKIIKFKKMKNNKYKVFFEDNTYMLLHEDIILKYNLISNKNIDDKMYDNIINDNNEYLIYDIAVKYIDIRLRSEKEIFEYLKRKNININLIEKIIKKLRENKLINDISYIKSYIYDKININKLGPNRIKKDLINLGFNKEDIDNELLNIDKSIILENLDSLITKKINQSKNYSGNVLKQKLINYFILQGYDSDDIISIINTKNLYDKDLLQIEYNKLYNKYSKKYSGNKLEMIIKQKLFQKGFYYNDI